MRMTKAKLVLGIIFFAFSLVGFVLTYDVYVTVNDWGDLPSGLLVSLPAVLAIFSLMFMLIGLALTLKELDTL